MMLSLLWGGGLHAQTYSWSVISAWPTDLGSYPSADSLCHAIWNEYQTQVASPSFQNYYGPVFIYPYQSPYPDGGGAKVLWCPLSFGTSTHLAGAGGSTVFLSGSSCPAGTVFNSIAGACEDGTQPIGRKQLGTPTDPLCGPPVAQGDPINSSTGNEFESEVDYEGGGPFPLRFARYYNSSDGLWRHNYATKLTISNSNIALTWFDGRVSLFALANGVATAEATELGNLSQVNGLWTYASPDGEILTFDAQGRLVTWAQRDGLAQTLTYAAVNAYGATPVTVTDDFGRTLSFQVDSMSRPLTFTAGGLTGTYTYSAPGELLSAKFTWSGGSATREYLYENANNITLLTGLIDEAGVRYSTWTYDSQNRAISSALGGGVGLTSLVYNSDGSTTATNPLGHTVSFQFQVVQGIRHVSSVAGAPAPNCPSSNASYTYDQRGQVATKLNALGYTTTYQNTANGLTTQKVEASATVSQRTTNWTWDSVLSAPLTRAVLDNNGNTVASTAWVYNAIGQPLARCEIDASQAAGYACAAAGTVPAGVRRWAYTYCTAVDTTQCPLIGLLLSVTGPRTDLTQTTSYSYYMSSSATSCGTPGAACHQAGDLYQVTDALGHVTTVASYDASGRVTRVTDANGINTDSTYTPRGWLASRTVGGATTTFAYTPYGAVASVTDPDNVTVSYTYDAAHRLTRLTDALGNYVQYTLDAAGNKMAEQVHDSGGTLHKSLSRTFNTLGQLTQVTDGLSNAVLNAGYSDSYDAAGNLVHTADGLGVQRKQGYDGLNRLVQTLDNYNGTDPATQNTQSAFAYDANDRLVGVSDPDGLNTTYAYDGLGNVTVVQSLDTGTTAYAYDAAGNVIQRTDANGVTSTSGYDALNRRIATTYTDGTLNVAYAYDEPNSTTGCLGSYPVGRLTRVIETNITTVYCYDQRGNVTQKSQIQGTAADVTAYGYTPANRLASTLTAAGTSIQYSRDADGRISGVTVLKPGSSGAGAGNMVTAVSYLPFGPIVSYTLGNGQTITRSYDANYALTDIVSPALNLHFARDAMGNITALGNASGANPATETYSYDPLYRLTGLYDASGNAEETYAYSKSGDRLSKTATGLDSGTYSYQSGTHHLTAIGNASRVYDADGNTTGSAVGGNTYGFGYNGRNRITVAQLNGSTVGTYTYNALGQRVAKVSTFPASTSQRFVYNESSQLLSEYGSNTRDYIWLDDLPVATVDTQGSVSTISYVTSDGLNTPRAVTDGSGNTLWQWSYQGNSFGEQQPTSTTGYVLNLRFMGQYYDAESGLSHNGYRDYEAARGGYDQPDPLGPAGGPNPFAYVGNRPLGYIDPLGLEPHHYTVTDFICSVSQPGCTPQNVFDRLRQYPAPFSDPSHPINTGDTETIPWLGPVVHSVDPSNCSITNTTLPGHKLYPGQVTRSVVNNNGMISIVTDGTGDGPMSTLNDALAYPLWSTVDGNISAPWIASPPAYTDAPIEAGLHWGH